jgi:hypothetical protein
MPRIFHWGGPRHGEIDQVPAKLLASSVLVYDGPHWFGVYQRFQPVQVRSTPASRPEQEGPDRRGSVSGAVLIAGPRRRPGERLTSSG